ncbi:DUF3606 domain-containing protein [Pedobacter aquatilis]|uniref:DUF3606 domain-containing protein n=1 Tax=Pedobacter aquatilis TaxID=351343 RepID=UPI00292FD98F|nr:DUF3606 domain-containing protein [Pedobacter aquatilis]
MNQQIILDPRDEFIGIAEEQDRNYWAERLGVSIETLKSAIRASKSTALESVKNYLAQKNK